MMLRAAQEAEPGLRTQPRADEPDGPERGCGFNTGSRSSWSLFQAA